MAHKTSTELQQELAILQQALADANKLASERSSNSYRVQAVQQAVVLGNVGQGELIAAQAALDKSVEALVQVSRLQAAITETETNIEWAKGQERTRLCESIRDEYSATFAAYTEQSKALLATFKTLNTLHNKHMALTSRPLLAPDQSLFCLPVCHNRTDDIRSFPTGQQVMSGALK